MSDVALGPMHTIAMLSYSNCLSNLWILMGVTITIPLTHIQVLAVFISTFMAEI